MKTIVLLSLCLSFISSASPITPPSLGGIPENIPFGKHVVTSALAAVSEGNIQIYGNGLSETSNLSFDFEPVDSTQQLSDIVRLHKPTVRVKNPLEIVWIRSALKDDEGKERLVAYSSYRHVVKRDFKGRKTYVVPRYAGSLYYEVAEQSFVISGAETAVAVAVDGNMYELSVVKGKVTIPSFIASNPEYWNYIQITLKGGEIVQYDQGGTRLRETVDLLALAYIGVQSIYQVYLEDMDLNLTLAPQYAWNPIVEFANNEKRHITLNLMSSESGVRPTYVRIYTLDQERLGTKPDWIEYNPEDSDTYQESIQVLLESGTYYMEVEWPTWLVYNPHGGKG